MTRDRRSKDPARDDALARDLIGVLTRLANLPAQERCLGCGHFAYPDRPCPHCHPEPQPVHACCPDCGRRFTVG